MRLLPAAMHAHAGGFGLTIAAGYGFIIKKTAQDAYGNRWAGVML